MDTLNTPERFIVDLNEIEVCLDISRCIKNSHPVVAIDFTLTLLKYVQKYESGNFNKNHIDKIYSEALKCSENLMEFNHYLNIADSLYKKDKNPDGTERLKLGIPCCSIKLTIAELLTLYEILTLCEDSYSYIKTKSLINESEKSYFENIMDLKNALAERLSAVLLSRLCRKSFIFPAVL